VLFGSFNRGFKSWRKKRDLFTSHAAGVLTPLYKDYVYGILLLELTIFHYYIVVVACEYFNIVFI
jgi:hypothetical protein